MLMQIKKGFTLAETLLTLMIVGVVATMSIPNLITKTQEKEWNVGLKKVYSVLSSATKQLIQDNGGSLKGAFTDGDHNGLRDDYEKYINFVKKCDSGTASGNCWHVHDGNGDWKNYDGTPVNQSWWLNSVGITNDGMLINFSLPNSSCGNNSWITDPIGCGVIITDINGFKGPNTIGKDIFYFYILENKLIPWGAPESPGHNCAQHSTGVYCAAEKLLK